jgi:hypothetical protein
MRGTAFWLYQNIAGYTFRDHPNEYARPLLRARRCARQDVLMSTKMPGQERLSPIREAFPLTRTRRPVKRLKIRRAVLPPNILKKPFPPEGDGRGRNYLYTGSHRITQFYTAVHNYCRNSLLFPQPNTVFYYPCFTKGTNLTHCRMYFCIHKSILADGGLLFIKNELRVFLLPPLDFGVGREFLPSKNTSCTARGRALIAY